MTLPNPLNVTAVLIKLKRNCNKARFLFKSGPALVWSASVCKLDPERWLVWQNNPNHSIRGFSFHGCCPRKFWTGKPQRLLNFLPELLCFSWLRCLPHQLTVLHSIQTPFSFLPPQNSHHRDNQQLRRSRHANFQYNKGYRKINSPCKWNDLTHFPSLLLRDVFFFLEDLSFSVACHGLKCLMQFSGRKNRQEDFFTQNQ